MRDRDRGEGGGWLLRLLLAAGVLRVARGVDQRVAGVRLDVWMEPPPKTKTLLKKNWPAEHSAFLITEKQYSHKGCNAACAQAAPQGEGGASASLACLEARDVVYLEATGVLKDLHLLWFALRRPDRNGSVEPVVPPADGARTRLPYVQNTDGRNPSVLTCSPEQGSRVVDFEFITDLNYFDDKNCASWSAAEGIYRDACWVSKHCLCGAPGFSDPTYWERYDKQISAIEQEQGPVFFTYLFLCSLLALVLLLRIVALHCMNWAYSTSWVGLGRSGPTKSMAPIKKSEQVRLSVKLKLREAHDAARRMRWMVQDTLLSLAAAGWAFCGVPILMAFIGRWPTLVAVEFSSRYSIFSKATLANNPMLIPLMLLPLNMAVVLMALRPHQRKAILALLIIWLLFCVINVLVYTSYVVNMILFRSEVLFSNHLAVQMPDDEEPLEFYALPLRPFVERAVTTGVTIDDHLANREFWSPQDGYKLAISAAVVAVYFSGGVFAARSLCLDAPVMLRRLWVSVRACFACTGALYFVHAAFIRDSPASPRPSFLLGTTWLLCGAVLLHPYTRRWAINSLYRLGSTPQEREAAVIASLFRASGRERPPEEVLDHARACFRSIKFNELRREDLLDGADRGGPEDALADGAGSVLTLFARTQVRDLGGVDAFVSHSWHDPPGPKWAMLRGWALAFEAAHGRSPRLWLDKACIDQRNIGKSLAFLPIFASGCDTLLVLAGPTYASRLWCILELYIFLKMGASESRITVLPVAMGDSEVAREDAVAKLEATFESFDVRQATCSDPEDRMALLKCISSSMAVGEFNRWVRSVYRTRVLNRLPLASTSASKRSVSAGFGSDSAGRTTAVLMAPSTLV